MSSDWDDETLQRNVRSSRRVVLARRGRQPAGRKQHQAWRARRAICAAGLDEAVEARVAEVYEARVAKRPRVTPTYDLQAQLRRWPISTSPRGKPIRFASDCSGLESFMFAFQALKLQRRVRLVFCSEVDKQCRSLLNHMHKPLVMYNDLRKRDIEKMPSEVDVYAAGFPCQPWSSAGLGEGAQDRQGRGRVFQHVLAYIRKKQPRCFVLENVRGLRSAPHKAAFERMLRCLRGDNTYTVTSRILNTLMFGIPQNRPRLFIIGFLNSASKPKLFRWPVSGGAKPKPLNDFLCGGRVLVNPPKEHTRAAQKLKELVHELKCARADYQHTPFALDVFARRVSARENRLPGLTRAAGGRGGFYITSKKRFLTLQEMLVLQGLPSNLAQVARDLGITDRQLGQMVGNAISTNILQLLLSRILTALELQ